MPADAAEVEKPFINDVMDDESYLVHVPDEHDLHPSVKVHRRRDVPMKVGRGHSASGSV